MGKRGQQSAEKRRIDKMRQEKQAAKRERRQGGGPEGADGEAVDTEAIMERFRILSEAHAAGKVSDEDFEPARHALMVELGVEEPREPEVDEDDE
jgi:hypothetical protein